ncbi:hypothetical protein FB192DRAFT_1387676 [Mucor lusitanicus]|uniref:Uncharacterized protein n=1 Tax=Mucor circinelloides f. lusitanicus TaxID=29924 RepID=A0A8H4BCQ7_MUCCL|nr:hypothetical protein FB192DRAFT_1387676 [Mucor lusitanicus]
MDGALGVAVMCVLCNASVILSSPDDMEKRFSCVERLSCWFILKRREREMNSCHERDMTRFHLIQTRAFFLETIYHPFLSSFPTFLKSMSSSEQDDAWAYINHDRGKPHTRRLTTSRSSSTVSTSRFYNQSTTPTTAAAAIKPEWLTTQMIPPRNSSDSEVSNLAPSTILIRNKRPLLQPSASRRKRPRDPPTDAHFTIKTPLQTRSPSLFERPNPCEIIRPGQS